MIVEEIKIQEVRHLITFGCAKINGVEVEFAYNKKDDKFTAIVYDVYQADGKFPEVHNQKYLVGRAIAKAYNEEK